MSVEDNKPVFSRKQAVTFATVEVRFPSLYPSTIEAPFTVFMRLQLVKEAEQAQSKFLALTDDEQEEATHDYDAEMLSILSVKYPLGFDDFSVIGDSSPEVMKNAIRDYFMFPEGSEDERKGMAFICRALLSKYRRTVNPTDYL